MIEFRDVHASYDASLPILKGVSFRIEDGEFVAFAGTNGAGKSTTMRLMNGLLKPESGEVLVDGVPTTELKTSTLARKVGFLFQNPDRQICCNTVREELLFGFEALGYAESAGAGADGAAGTAGADGAAGTAGADGAAAGAITREYAEARVDAVIEEFGFDPQADPFLLNRGTRQLLALASVIVLELPMVILDEPTTGLDFRECSKVMEMVRRLHDSGTTVIMVCHDMEVVGDYAQRVIMMTDGRVVDDGPTFEVLRNRETLRRADLVPPQVVGVSLALSEMRPELAGSGMARANTLDEMMAGLKRFMQERRG